MASLAAPQVINTNGSTRDVLPIPPEKDRCPPIDPAHCNKYEKECESRFFTHPATWNLVRADSPNLIIAVRDLKRQNSRKSDEKKSSLGLNLGQKLVSHNT